jgi:hypothetical protein
MRVILINVIILQLDIHMMNNLLFLRKISQANYMIYSIDHFYNMKSLILMISLLQWTFNKISIKYKRLYHPNRYWCKLITIKTIYILIFILCREGNDEFIILIIYTDNITIVQF